MQTARRFVEDFYPIIAAFGVILGGTVAMLHDSLVLLHNAHFWRF